LTSVHAVFSRTAARHGDRPFVHIPAPATRGYAGGALECRYAEAAARIAELAEAYAAAGYRRGQRVGLVLENRLEFFLHFIALNALGVSAVPINAELQPEELAYLAGHSDVCLIVSLPAHAARVRDAAGEVAVCEAGASLPAADGPPVASEDEAAMLYTSGTTGRPKGCMLSNHYFVRMGEWYRDLGGYCTLRPGEERLITPLPLVHMNALACSTMGMIQTGGCIVQLDRFHASTWWQSVRESGATCLHYLGVMPAILLNRPPSPEDAAGAQIRFGFGAGVDPKHQERFEQRFGFPLIEGWAMTETGAAACVMANVEPRHAGTRCFGRPPAYMQHRLIDDAGADVPPGAPGELLVRSAGPDPRAGFFTGYYKDPEATEAAWRGGWFHTGDVVRQGEDGSLHFVDRKKNVIRRSGENIAAVEVEGALFQHPAVLNCAVAPVADDIRGEEVMACVIARAGTERTAETAAALFEHCRERLAYFKAPGWIAFVDALPTTATQKVQRGEMKKLAARLLAGGDAIDLRERKRRRG